jgi:energy-coupling factor transporter ATP-binding protein EcfA2
MIEIQNLHHHYSDGTRALKGIDLSISEGEFLLMCGPNGSGKSNILSSFHNVSPSIIFKEKSSG